MLPENLAAALADPPRAYSPVPIWWWSGEPLRAERLRWQLERFAEGGVYNLVVLNLAPSGPAHGCDADDPPFFSEAWWELFLGACADAKRLGISLWFYDQLGFSGAAIQARLVARRPEFAGRRLHRSKVVTEHGFDYLAKDACAALLDQVHGEFARRLGDLLGTVVVGSFQDELPDIPNWSAGFADAFAARYGYHLLDRLDALWDSSDPGAGRVRRDYHALRAALAEEAFFRPLADWHERHGLLVGCDQQDPARAGHPIEGVRLYADYPRTHRWFSAPGSDHHGDARIHSSLAHLYGRPRTWIEAFHSTGWGGTLEETLDWLLPWLRTGATLYNPHAVYYSTKAGWWEWAPPATDWRQPYWRHHKHFADTVTRMCAALSLGRHACDVAVLFPNTTVQADLRLDGPGPDALRAQAVYRELVGDAAWFAPVTGALDQAKVDFDVIDDDSVAGAEVTAGRLSVAGEAYRAIILPAVTVLEEATAQRLAEFVAAGGLLVAVGEPVSGARYVEASAGVEGALADLSPRVEADVPVLAREVDGALAVFVTATSWSATITGGSPENRGPGHGWDNVGYTFDPDRYLRSVKVRVRDAPGRPVLASFFGGAPRPLPYTVDGDVTEVMVPFRDGPAALLVFTSQVPAVTETTVDSWDEVALDGDWDAELIPTLDNTWGDFAWPARPATAVERWELEHRVDGDEEWRPAVATFGPHGLIDGKPTEYSQTRGIHKDWVHRRALGPKGHVPEEFLDFGTVPAGTATRFHASLSSVEDLTVAVAVGAPAAKRLWLDGEPVPIDDGGGHLGTAPVHLTAGRHEVELELTPDVEMPLRAHLAFVRDEAGYRRPEWISLEGCAEFGTIVTGPLTGAPFHLTALGGARLLVNGEEVGRQGGFVPYERPIPEVRRYHLTLRPGPHEVVVELDKPSPILVDGPVVSDNHWWGRVGGVRVPARRHRQQYRVPADLHVRRRPHPLPGTAWLEGTQDDNVLPITFGVPRSSGTRIEWLRFDIPPGARTLDFDVHGDASLLVDGAEVARGELPPGARQGLLRVVTSPGYEAGAALAGPIRFAVGPGRLALGDWERQGLAGYSGGVRYRRRVDLPAAGRLLLDLGKVRGTAEVKVDGRSAGVRFCSPYTFDITESPGRHQLDIEVFGTLAPYLDAVSPTHFIFEGQRVSGLFGPVLLRHRRGGEQ